MTFAEMAAIMDRDRPSPDHDAAQDAADAKLAADYPGRYVAYRDHWTGDELRREILAVGDEIDEIDSVIGHLSNAEILKVCVDYIGHGSEPGHLGWDFVATPLARAGRGG